jgi:hypothetical protein
MRHVSKAQFSCDSYNIHAKYLSKRMQDHGFLGTDLIKLVSLQYFTSTCRYKLLYMTKNIPLLINEGRPFGGISHSQNQLMMQLTGTTVL